MERVTGIGGVAIRRRSSPGTTSTSASRSTTRATSSSRRAATRTGVPFPEETAYWPAEKQSMVNFTVSDLDAMLAQLRTAGVPVEDEVEEHEFGRFGWAGDPEGNRFELWQPAQPTRG